MHNTLSPAQQFLLDVMRIAVEGLVLLATLAALIVWLV